MIATQPGSQWTVHVSAEQSGGRFAVVEILLGHGAALPRHIHGREDELIHVMQGEVTFERDGERFDGPAGTWCYLPRGSEHTFAVLSHEARLLVLLCPAGLEGSLSELAQAATCLPAPLHIERLVTTAARHGVSITGPAGEEGRSA